MSPQEETASLAQHQFFKCGESVRNIKDVVTCVTLGDERVGKTSLVISYISNGFPSDYIPTAFDKYSVLITINSEPYTLQINDTAGQSDFDIFRAFCYPNVDVFLLCFSVVNPASIKNIKSKWLKEIRDSNALVPIVLVGTQQDLRNDVKVLLELAKHGQRPITEEECKTLAKDIGAVGYMECSALTQKNLKETFDYIVAVGLKYIESGRPSKDSGIDFRFSRFSIKRSSIPSVRIVQKNVLKFQSSCPKPWWRRTFCCCV